MTFIILPALITALLLLLQSWATPSTLLSRSVFEHMLEAHRIVEVHFNRSEVNTTASDLGNLCYSEHFLI
jgi:hypothetical protein